MKCVNCGTENPEEAKFCFKCGKDISFRQESILLKDYNSLRNSVIKHKSIALGYVVWVIINCILLIFGGKSYVTKEGIWQNTVYHKAKDAFFPFAGKAENYDFSEFFIYVIAIPIIALIVCYFYKKCKALISNNRR